MADQYQAEIPDCESSREGFIRNYGSVYESSSWIAEEAWRQGVRGTAADDTASALREIVENSGRQVQLALLRAHPDLAGRLAMRDALTPESAAEQSGAGLDRCSPGEFAEFQDLNERYKKKFGFPFIFAVRGRNRREILDAFRQRVENDSGSEFREALNQVHRIARFRIEAVARTGD